MTNLVKRLYKQESIYLVADESKVLSFVLPAESQSLGKTKVKSMKAESCKAVIS